MGIDKPDVRTVVHIQLPTTLEAYYQEAGRAGRDGAPAECIAFHARSDRKLGRSFIDRTHPPDRHLRRAHARLRAAACERGIACLSDSSFAEAFGPDLRAWLGGDPVGVLGALERAGAIRRLNTRPGRGSEDDAASAAEGAVEEAGRVGVARRLDLSGVAHLRSRAREKLQAVEAYAQSRRCRRGSLLAYFGEEASGACGRCDRCYARERTDDSP
jgi:ATP-dependent DNA helicase RecQ